MKGQITVFLSLIFTIMVSFLLTVIEGARIQAIRFQTECIMDMAVNSVLAEYNRELFTQYDLLFIDTSYGRQQGHLRNTKEHIREYMNANLKPYDNDSYIQYEDLLKLTTEDVSILRAAAASDENGACVMSQILTYMKGKAGINFLERYLQQRWGGMWSGCGF